MSRFRFVHDHRRLRREAALQSRCRARATTHGAGARRRPGPPGRRSSRAHQRDPLPQPHHLWGTEVHAELRRIDQRCSRKRVARLMAKAGLVSVHARRRWRAGRPDVAPAPDLVGRNFNPAGSDRVWAADMTQFRTEQGWLYLAVVVDLFSRRVVGWAMVLAELGSRHRRLAHGLRAPASRPTRRPSFRPRRGLHLAGLLPAPGRPRVRPELRLHRRLL